MVYQPPPTAPQVHSRVTGAGAVEDRFGTSKRTTPEVTTLKKHFIDRLIFVSLIVASL
jgi:hypothetical protein